MTTTTLWENGDLWESRGPNTQCRQTSYKSIGTGDEGWHDRYPGLTPEECRQKCADYPSCGVGYVPAGVGYVPAAATVIFLDYPTNTSTCEVWIPHAHFYRPGKLDHQCWFKVEGTIRSAGDEGQTTVVGDTPFTPEVHFHGAYQPICFEDEHRSVNEIVDMVCLAAGFGDGGYVQHAMDTPHSKDAIPIGRCDVSTFTPAGSAARLQHKSLSTCFQNEDKFSSGTDIFELPEQCKAGRAIHRVIACNLRCRTYPKHLLSNNGLPNVLSTTSEDTDPGMATVFPTCHPYLDNTTLYYLVDTERLDHASMTGGFSLIGEVAGFIEKAINAGCASNIIALLCHAAFKECKEVTDVVSGSQIWVPSLLCRSECKTHWNKWMQCLEKLHTGPEKTQKEFEVQMQSLTDMLALGSSAIFREELPSGPEGQRSPFRLLECDSPGGDTDLIPEEDSAIAFILGQWPANPEVIYPEHGEFNASVSIHFPANINTDALYPNETVTYTHPTGEQQEVPCFIPNDITMLIDEVVCPYPFVPPLSEYNIESCIQPCPVNAYTNAEYTWMWTTANGIGLLGFGLNLFVALTWGMGGPSTFRNVSYQLKWCVFAGLLYALVETIPSLLAKEKLACMCETEECTGKSVACAINRISIYILLSILVNLCFLMYQIHSAMARQQFNKRHLNFCC